MAHSSTLDQKILLFEVFLVPPGPQSPCPCAMTQFQTGSHWTDTRALGQGVSNKDVSEPELPQPIMIILLNS